MIAVEEVLAEFTKITGLEVNYAKTSLLVGGRSIEASKELASILKVQYVRRPVTYLGIPLTSSRLGIKDCQPILEKTLQRISNWKSRFLSLAGRHQLILSVLSAFHIFWSQTFILPGSVLDTMAKKCATFLWNGFLMGRKMHQASLSTICLSKEKGGSGMTNMKVWNQAAYLGLVFKIAVKGPSLWVQWAWEYHLKNKFFWTMKIPSDCSWVWRCVLKARENAAKLSVYTLADGKDTYIWHDLWCDEAPLWNNLVARQEWGSLGS
ncbi:Zf-rvt domain-containing protein [Thalictrum thalictroides]|uniref:Zf-rvt domain-containing protein n=1 Tax=Thalictrum thalictroides TaxID=46969 RepID=A0A7J6WY02_THATH|nr:Zf-rvt domain-containing protein [Thalictrum thalictroides]